MPTQFPGLLILDDSSPVLEHDAGLIAEQISKLSVSSLLLDFQRPPTEKSLGMAKALVDRLTCPVGVAESHAEALDCPIFLPPPPMYLPLEQYIAPRQGREIWLEVALGRECVVITGNGLHSLDSYPPSQNPVHYAKELACHYQIAPDACEVRFLLHRTREDLNELLGLAESLGIQRAIGLYQELQ